MLRISVAAGILGIIASASFAADNTVVGAVALNKPLGVRQMGAGGVGIGNGGVMGMWSNPAFLLDMETQGEVSLGGGALNDGNESLTALGGGWKFADNWALGGYFGMNGIAFKEVDGFGNEMGGELNDNLISLSVVGAYRWKWLTVGGGPKFAVQNIMDQSYKAPCGDLGLAGNWGNWAAGLSFRNLGGRIIQPETKEIEAIYPDGVSLPTEFRLGGSYAFTGIRLTPALEIRSTAGRDAMIGLAANWWANNWLGLRMGLSGPMGSSKGDSSIDYADSSGQDGGYSSFTLGLTALYKSFGFNMGFATGSTGASARMDVSYSIGPRAGQPEEVREPEQPKEEVKKDEPPVVAPKPGSAKLNFAIADLRGENVSAGDAAVMADLLRNELVKTEQFTVIEKQNMDKVLAEHAFQQTGCSSEECAVKLGKLLNVQRMAVGSFGKLMDSYILSIRVVNVETGAIIYADSAEGEKVSQLRVGVKDMAVRMAKKIR